jgi:hypothetical protein
MSNGCSLEEGYNLLETSRFGCYSNILLVKVQADVSEDKKGNQYEREFGNALPYVAVHLLTALDTGNLAQTFSQEVTNIICILPSHRHNVSVMTIIAF